MHDRRTVVVVVLRLRFVRAADVEESDGAAVDALHLHFAELAAAREREGAEEEVVRSDHKHLLPPTVRSISASRSRRSGDTPHGPKCA